MANSSSMEIEYPVNENIQKRQAIEIKSGYQSYIFCFLSMGLGIVLLKVDQNSSISNRYIIRSLGYLFLIVCASLLLYYSTDFTFKFIYGVSSNTYISGFINLEALLKFPGDVIVSTLHEAKQIYLGSSKIFGVSLGAMLIALQRYNLNVHSLFGMKILLMKL
jgi:hypothetical protein